MKAVISVVRNRVKSKKFPKTICNVVYQQGQFSWVKKPAKINLNSKEWKQAYELAGTQFDDTAGGALYFWNHKRVTPSWSLRLKITIKTRYHTYGK